MQIYLQVTPPCYPVRVLIAIRNHIPIIIIPDVLQPYDGGLDEKGLVSDGTSVLAEIPRVTPLI